MSFVDLYFSARLLAEGGVVLLDDASDPHVRKVIRFIRANMSHALREMDLTEFRIAGSAADRLKYRIARATGRVQLAGFQCIGGPVRKWDSPFGAF